MSKEDPDILAIFTPLFTPLEIAAMRARAEHWKKNRADLEHWIEDGLLFDIQVVQQIASGELYLGKSGATQMGKALIEYPKLAEKVLRLIRGDDKKEGE